MFKVGGRNSFSTLECIVAHLDSRCRRRERFTRESVRVVGVRQLGAQSSARHVVFVEARVLEVLTDLRRAAYTVRTVRAGRITRVRKYFDNFPPQSVLLSTSAIG